MKKKEKKTPVLKRLMVYAGRKGYMLYLAMVLSAAAGVLILMPMVFIHRIVSRIILSAQADVTVIGRDAVCAAAYAGAGIVLYLCALILSHIFAFEVEDNIIRLNVRKLMNKPLGYFVNHESGKIRNVIMDGAAETHSFLAHQLPDMAMTLVAPLVLLIFFFIFDWRLGLVCMIPIMAGMSLMGTMMSKEARVLKDEYFACLASLSAEAVEYVRCIPVVKTFANSVENFERFYTLIIKTKDVVMRLTMSYKNKMAVYESVVSSTAFFLVPCSILLIAAGGNARVIIGNSVIYFLIGPSFASFIMRSATIYQYAYFAELALNKIDDILNYADFSYGEKEGEGSSIEFRNVSFSYGKDRVLNQISFQVNKGETVALVGASGGGKSTIARLAARFYDADEGEVLIGGVNVKEYGRAALMKKISFVFQNSRLFKMSLRNNLLIGKGDASEQELAGAIRSSGSEEIVRKLPDGLETVYGTKGTYFSGGEAQRLSIARVFLKDADIVILDEATAFTDPENEQLIQTAFRELSRNKTTLMIAHRLSTVVNADRILVIEGGRIVEEGKHEELLQKNGVYGRLWEEYQRAVHWRIGGRND